MTDVPENTFDAAVEAHLSAMFPAAEIAYQVRLPTSGRVADFIVTHETPGDGANLVHAVEVENDFEAMFKGTAQALLYAGHFAHAVPVVAYPQSHTEQPEFRYLKTHSPAVYLGVPDNGD